MGLAAGQARLLTITGRKSDCEYESMRLSHQKIAMARQLADLSNEYQASLDKTKLYYDYYGKGDTSNQLSYGILMTPSALNNYMPTLITDTAGRVTLNSKYAAAARAAGIPQEGLGTLPSENMRNEFIQGLYGVGILTKRMASTILGLPYNQQAGLGGGSTVSISTQSGSLKDLLEAMDAGGETITIDQSTFPTKDRTNAKGKGDKSDFWLIEGKTGTDEHTWTAGGKADVKLSDLLNGDKQYYLGYEGIKGEQSPVFGVALMQSYLTDDGGFIDKLRDMFEPYLNLGDAYSQSALDYAYNNTKELLCKSDTSDNKYQIDGKNVTSHDWWNAQDMGKDTDENTQYKHNHVYDYLGKVGTRVCGDSSDDEAYRNWMVTDSEDYVGFTFIGSGKSGGDNGNDHATGGINLNNIAKAFLTYYADYMNGVSKTDSSGKDKYCVAIGATRSGQSKSGRNGLAQTNRLVTDDTTFEYTWKTGSSVSSDDLAQATFYDALFNQLCSKGWTENEKIEDKEYLQQILQSGMGFISKMKDDNYYYQGNYSTDSYIKEISDDTAIAAAEAKYSTEKAKLNAKEQTLDLKMKNLDTEISSLTTEYDTVKNTISKNIEKSFKRYSA